MMIQINRLIFLFIFSSILHSCFSSRKSIIIDLKKYRLQNVYRCDDDLTLCQEGYILGELEYSYKCTNTYLSYNKKYFKFIITVEDNNTPVPLSRVFTGTNNAGKIENIKLLGLSDSSGVYKGKITIQKDMILGVKPPGGVVRLFDVGKLRY